MAKGHKDLLASAKSQSVYKHALLKDYLPQFVGKVANRGAAVTLVDGFAGTGYAGTELGSAGTMMQLSAEFKGRFDCEIYTVEKDPKNFEKLEELAQRYRSEGTTITCRRGTIEEHLLEAVTSAHGRALFLFLDPCGAQVPFDLLVKALGTRGTHTWPPTELMLNFSADLTRRTAGHILKNHNDPSAIDRLNLICGGDWWIQLAHDFGPKSTDGNYLEFAEATAREYSQRLAHALYGFKPSVAPVRRREGHQPVYHLIHLTRKDIGVEAFFHSMADAREPWLLATDDDYKEPYEASGQFTFGDVLSSERLVEVRVAGERSSGREHLKRNILALMEHEKLFMPIEHIPEILGEYAGICNRTDVGKALGELVREKKIVQRTADRYPTRRIYIFPPKAT